MKRYTGTVLWFNENKGFGRIYCEELHTKEAFVHFSEIQMPVQRRLKEGQLVNFCVKFNSMGPYAKKVLPVEAIEDLSSSQKV